MARYICTNCARTTTSLYRVYSTPGSIQLTTCKNCSRDVDPYIEREWLLVIMDCVLHRPEAFRHVLYNRKPFCDFDVSGKPAIAAIQRLGEKKQNGDEKDRSDTETTCGDRSPDNNSLRRLVRYSIMASLLRTYLWYVSTDASRENVAPEIIVSLVQSIVGEVGLVIATVLSSSFIIKHVTTLQINEGHNSEMDNNVTAFFCSRLHLALTIPTFFHVATIFALIWENSSTVCMLGTLIVLSLQCMGVAIVMEERMGRGHDSSKVDAQILQQRRYLWTCLLHSFPFIIGLILRTLAVSAINKLLVSVLGVESSQACAGIDLFRTGPFYVL